MFTGIVEALGTVLQSEAYGSGKAFWLTCPFVDALRVDESLSHNGACLTVAALESDRYQVVAVEETLLRTNLGQWQVGDVVNLERSMPANGRFDGHIVQGHVDAVGTLESVEDRDGSWLLTFRFPPEYAGLVVEKGSCCINGVSLTIFNIGQDRMQVAIIPYTWTHTNLSSLLPGAPVNVEFDLVGKYLLRQLKIEKVKLKI
jgi:riboflavin synthase